MRAVAAFLTSIMSLIMVSFPAAAQPGLADYAEPLLIWGGNLSGRIHAGARLYGR